MSRNLCKSSCCDNIVRLSNLRGQPIEFRRYAVDPPVLGTRWNCPTCGTAYFAMWMGSQINPSNYRWSDFEIDLSYYESFDDEHSNTSFDNPSYLCLDDAEDIQNVL